MNTYETYQAAKIANPKAQIYVDDQGKFIPGFDVFGRKPGMFCAHTDYCISVSQFLSEGHKGVEGDLYIVGGGCVLEVGKTINEHRFNDPKAKNGDMYVLKAKALEETKTYRYEKVDFKKASEAVALVEDGGSFWVSKTEGLNPFWVEVCNLHGAVSDWEFAHRRIEVTERELFIEEVVNLANKFAEWKGLQRVDDLDMDFFCYLFESGKFNLVNGKG